MHFAALILYISSKILFFYFGIISLNLNYEFLKCLIRLNIHIYTFELPCTMSMHAYMCDPIRQSRIETVSKINRLYKIRRYGMIDSKNTIHQQPNDVFISYYMSPYDLQQ